ncbi:penicillin-binding transpeptidase domain-containing protein [Alicyclobacillus shizuokensis]|uniref:penicillin-binding transpeptidase domain-containing protein n=1 Tax=Alicyclobacillus shizuokensis TaxID=392014 RepID=UPI00082CF659|nr:penicillin-binding transpeptidase domain-containing protein [Alicyclobacillus shizuokensis]
MTGAVNGRRWLWMVTLWWVAVAALLGRLFVVAVRPETASPGIGDEREARWRMDSEHFHPLLVDDGRGQIRFRSGQPWSGAKRWIQFTSPNGARLSWRVHTEAHSGLVDPVVGRIGLPDHWPDAGRLVLEQGRSGLEYTFDRWLASGRPGFVGWLEDARGRTRGGWYTRPGTPGIDVRTTVDAAWQGEAEAILAESGATQAALVVLDVDSGDVLAMASRDVHDPWRNHAVQPETPGSVFKLVTMAAALESYRFQPDARFFCAGVVPLVGVRMHCWRAHGRETLAQALAGSCDVAFALVGAAVGPVGLQVMAERLGLYETGLQTHSGLRVLAEAAPGRVFVAPRRDVGLLANTAIGQQDVRMSPLQAANLAATIARGGVYRDARLVIDLESPGAGRRELTSGPGRRALSPGVAHAIGQAMRAAVREPQGTAHALVSAPVPVAVKTGTAELPRAGRVHAWLVGYFPASRPRIAFSVAVFNASEAPAHHQVFTAVRRLTSWYRQFHSPTDIP